MTGSPKTFFIKYLKGLFAKLCTYFLFFCLLQLNYSRLIKEIDGELQQDIRSSRQLPKFIDKALRLLNLKQVVQEVETSVMSKVSCTACKAGNYFSLFEQNFSKCKNN